MKYYIYQLSEKPIKESDGKDTISFDPHDPPLPYIAFVKPVQDRNHVLKRLRRWLKLYGLGDLKQNCMVLLPSVRKKYFQPRFEEFHNLLRELSTVSLDRFMSEEESTPRRLFKLNDSYSSKSDCHFLLENGSLITMDQFMRNAEPKKPYYIGVVLEFTYIASEVV